MKQLSQQHGDLQVSVSSDAITKLFKQQTQWMRSITDANSQSGIESQITHCKASNIRRTHKGMEAVYGNVSMIHSNENIPNIQKFQYYVGKR